MQEIYFVFRYSCPKTIGS